MKTSFLKLLSVFFFDRLVTFQPLKAACHFFPITFFAQKKYRGLSSGSA
jgi:hypothetical protein